MQFRSRYVRFAALAVLLIAALLLQACTAVQPAGTAAGGAAAAAPAADGAGNRDIGRRPDQRGRYRHPVRPRPWYRHFDSRPACRG